MIRLVFFKWPDGCSPSALQPYSCQMGSGQFDMNKSLNQNGDSNNKPLPSHNRLVPFLFLGPNCLKKCNLLDKKAIITLI